MASASMQSRNTGAEGQSEAAVQGYDDTTEKSSPSLPIPIGSSALQTGASSSGLSRLSTSRPPPIGEKSAARPSSAASILAQQYAASSPKIVRMASDGHRSKTPIVSPQPVHSHLLSVNPASRNDSRPQTPIKTNPDGTPNIYQPSLLTELTASDGESILSLAVEEHSQGGGLDDVHGRFSVKSKRKGGRVYGGSQGGSIHVWDLYTLTLQARLTGHDGAVIALQCIQEHDWLFSASGDGTIRVWHTPTLTALYLVHAPHDNVGDILSLAWAPFDSLTEVPSEHAQKDSSSRSHAKVKGRLYSGCQDTSIQWIDLPPPSHVGTPDVPADSPMTRALSDFHSNSASSSPPIRHAPNKFFDSLSTAERPRSHLGRNAQSGTNLSSLPAEMHMHMDGTPDIGSSATSSADNIVELQIENSNIAHYAHHGYVYDLQVARSNDKMVLVSGSGDELIKLWAMKYSELLHLHTLESNSDAVLSIGVRDSTIFAGHQGGVIKIWDLNTFTCIRNLRPHSDDILTLSVSADYLYSGSANGELQRWDKSFNLTGNWPAHNSIVLSSIISNCGGHHLITGGNDAVVKIWDIIGDEKDAATRQDAPIGFQRDMFHTLSKFVSFKSVADEEHREDCRQGALYLKNRLRQLGAETILLPGASGKNPILVATFSANAGVPGLSSVSPSEAKKRVLCYGHYDVVSATSGDKWTYDPFELTGKDGWVYGRGVSDNKGPILAIAAAAAGLRKKQELAVDLVMVIEGEEETGSAGFQDAIRKNIEHIGHIDVILVSNSYWIGEDIPCLTYGLRGVIHATIKITSDQPDLHSGIQGGVVSEPLVDMVRLLASLADSDGNVRIPGFLDKVRKLSQEESLLYDALLSRCDAQDKIKKHSHITDPKQSLLSRWRQPALSIHKVDVAGAAQKTLIPSWAAASVSIRTVPDQSLPDIVEQLKAHLNKAFGSLQTFNKLRIDINHVADWWLGDTKSEYFKRLFDCIKDEWGTEPLLIREGGSIPSIPFLEREFQAAAIQFPMGSSSDAAHLPDERIKIINLERGSSIVAKWLKSIADIEG